MEWIHYKLSTIQVPFLLECGMKQYATGAREKSGTHSTICIKSYPFFFCLAGQHDQYYKCIFCYIKSIITNATNFHRKLNGWKIVFYCLVGGRITELNVQIHFNWFAIYLPTYILATNVQPSRILYIILDVKTNPIWNGSQMVGTWLILFFSFKQLRIKLRCLMKWQQSINMYICVFLYPMQRC